MNNRLTAHTQRALATAALAALATLTALAAPANAGAQDGKDTDPKHLAPFLSFIQWVTTVVKPHAETPPDRIETLPLTYSGAATEQAYQPLPVILGTPDLPLSGAHRSGRGWGPGLNYQGMHLRQVVLNPSGTRVELRSMASPLRPGDRFKLRVTATFDAVAELDQVLGQPWYGKRGGQIYPQAGVSVQMRAGQSVDLPLDPNEWFAVDHAPNQRLLLSVRHAAALGAARSDQPAYRQDGKAGSNYLQLVPKGKYPALEQIVSQSQ